MTSKVHAIAKKGTVTTKPWGQGCVASELKKMEENFTLFRRRKNRTSTLKHNGNSKDTTERMTTAI